MEFKRLKKVEKFSNGKLSHYRAWTNAWLTLEPSELPADECLALIIQEAPRWLADPDITALESLDRLHTVVACFKNAAKARVILLGGKVPPSCDEVDVLSEHYDARVECDCSGLFPVRSDLDLTALKSCGCKAIERMFAEAEIVKSRGDEWNSSDFFSSEGLASAMEELALCNSDVQPNPPSCRREHDQTVWRQVRAPDRKPSLDNDLDEEVYHSLYPTHERLRLSADAKHFFAVASGASLIDPGIQLAIADSGNDILIADYCEAATEDGLAALRKIGAAAFSFLKVCVYADLMTSWAFDHLVAQTIHFRIIGYWRDHAQSKRPQGVYGSRMTGIVAHRHIDLGITLGVVSASMATGQTMSAIDFIDLNKTLTLINDLVDLRGDTWRDQRENVILRGIRGCLCTYLDSCLLECVGGAATMVRRAKVSALLVMCFCNWTLMGSGHQSYEVVHSVRPILSNPCCSYKSTSNGVYQELLGALEPYGTLAEAGPCNTHTRKELQVLYAKHRQSAEDHIKWMADVVRIVLHPGRLRKLVDVVHYSWNGELGDVDYCP